MAASKISEVFPAPITVLVGHAGTGKTNTALGLALALADEGYEVTVADLDVVNPYFRSSDYPELLDAANIRLIAPVMARTTLDTPSLTGELDVAIEQAVSTPAKRLIIDVGGDDDGAITIGRWAARLKAAQAQVLYVVSAYRSLTLQAEEAAALVPDIEYTSRLTMSAVLNSTNLGDETRAEHVRHGRSFAVEVSRLLGLPLAATVVPLVAAEALGPTAPSQGQHNAATIAPAWVNEALTDTGLDPEPLVLTPRLVRTPWD